MSLTNKQRPEHGVKLLAIFSAPIMKVIKKGGYTMKGLITTGVICVVVVAAIAIVKITKDNQTELPVREDI